MTESYDYRAARKAIFGAELSTAEKCLLLAMVEFAPSIRPSNQTLGVMTSMEWRSIIRVVKRLESMGALLVTRRSGATSEYELGTLPPLTEDHPCPTVTPDPECMDPCPTVTPPLTLSTLTPDPGSPEADLKQTKKQIRKQGSQDGSQLSMLPLTGPEQAAIDSLKSDETLRGRIKSGAREQVARDLCSARTDIDVASAIRAAGRWCRANPTKAPKTAWKRFLLGWINREGKGTAGRRPAAITQKTSDEMGEVERRLAAVRTARTGS